MLRECDDRLGIDDGVRADALGTTLEAVADADCFEFGFLLVANPGGISPDRELVREAFISTRVLACGIRDFVLSRASILTTFSFTRRAVIYLRNHPQQSIGFGL